MTDISEAKAHFSKLVELAAAGKEIIISKAGKPVARLVPYQEPKRKPGSMKGKIRISSDFDKVDQEIEAPTRGFCS